MSTNDCKEYELTLKFTLGTFGDSLNCPELAKMLNYILSDWQDGRHLFEAEMIIDGLARCLRRALHLLLEEEAQKEFGHEFVNHADGKGHTARWYLEAMERAKNLEVPWFNDVPKAEIVRCDEVS